jgi:hypothetical protein
VGTVKTTLLVSVCLLFGAGVIRADSPVYFADPDLKAAVEAALWVLDPTATDMLALTALHARGQGISDLTGLECALNLESLALNTNDISDLTPLAGLTNLTSLNLHDNEISSIAPLAGLTHLQTLILRINNISNISALAGLTSLEELALEDNQVSDISALADLVNLRDLRIGYNQISNLSPLSGLSNLEFLDVHGNRISNLSAVAGLTHLDTLKLSGNQISDISALQDVTGLARLELQYNPLNQAAYDVYLPQIRANNPGLYLQYDAHTQRYLSVSSSAGGSVLDPGEGEFTYDADVSVRLEARAEAGFVFVSWSGSYATTRNPVYLTMDQDHQMRANFLSTLGTLHVDDDAAGDPAPRDSTRSDPREDGTPEHPFDQIQEAIEVAAEGVTILVHPGTYRENISLPGKNIRLLGFNPTDPATDPYPVLEGAKTGAVVSFLSGEGRDCLLMGFVITRGQGSTASALCCSDSSPTVTNCVIVGNRASGPNSAAIHCTRSSATFLNCTITDSYGGPQGAGLVLSDSTIQMANSILWGNSPNEILCLGNSRASIRYCDVRGGWLDEGNLDSDPLFARRGSWINPSDSNEPSAPTDERAVWVPGDYHLKSQAGRWDSALGQWVQDEVSSPCIDRGDRATPVGYEPAPNGGIINLGAYGGTSQASKSGNAPGSP